MIGSTAAIQRDQVGLALGKAAGSVTQRGPGAWDFTLANGTALDGSARFEDDGWLRMDVPLGKRRLPATACSQRMWDLLTQHAALPGGVKYVLDAEGRVRGRTEIFVPDTDALGRDRVGKACRGLRLAARGFHQKRTPTRDPGPAAGVIGDADMTLGEVRELCREANWEFAERSDAWLAVTLDVPGEFHQARLEPCGTGARAAVRLGERPAQAGICRNALAVLLLTAGGVVRMARGLVEAPADSSPVGFEVVLDTRPTATELGHALSALSVACGLCGAEISVLSEDGRIASAYLAAQGWSR